MSDEQKQKMVFYDEYCPKCKNWKTDEVKDPCNECMDQPFNYDSHKPINFQEKS